VLSVSGDRGDERVPTTERALLPPAARWSAPRPPLGREQPTARDRACIVGDGQPDVLGVGVAGSKAAGIEGVVIERPRPPQAIFPAPLPPSVARLHIRVPDDVSVLLGAEEAHRRGHVGRGVTVAMADSDQLAHPFFAAHRYSVRPAVAIVPGTNPAIDPHGHGTDESANIVAIAPGHRSGRRVRLRRDRPAGVDLLERLPEPMVRRRAGADGLGPRRDAPAGLLHHAADPSGLPDRRRARDRGRRRLG
jgi:hypothetical protein